MIIMSKINSSVNSISPTSSLAIPQISQILELSNFTNQLPNITNPLSIKLDDSNFLEWKHQLLTVIKMLGFLHLISKNMVVPAKNSPEKSYWDNCDAYVHAIISATLSSSHLHLARNSVSASQLWSSIGDFFIQTEIARQHPLKTTTTEDVTGFIQPTESSGGVDGAELSNNGGDEDKLSKVSKTMALSTSSVTTATTAQMFRDFSLEVYTGDKDGCIISEKGGNPNCPTYTMGQEYGNKHLMEPSNCPTNIMGQKDYNPLNMCRGPTQNNYYGSYTGVNHFDDSILFGPCHAPNTVPSHIGSITSSGSHIGPVTPNELHTSGFDPSHFQTWASGSDRSHSTMHFGLMADLASTCQEAATWIPDSGATAHMTSDPSIVFGAIPHTGSERVIIGDGIILT